MRTCAYFDDVEACLRNLAAEDNFEAERAHAFASYSIARLLRTGLCSPHRAIREVRGLVLVGDDDVDIASAVFDASGGL